MGTHSFFRRAGATLLLGALMLTVGCRREPEPQPSPATSVRPAQSATLKEPSPEPSQSFQHFVHVSELHKEGVSEGYGRPYAIAQVADRHTLVSLDHHASEEHLDILFRLLEAKKPAFSLYIEGPGGPTGEEGEFQADELMRIARLAQQYCQNPVTDPKGRFVNDQGALSLREDDYRDYTTADLDHLPWMKEWNSKGWPRYFREVNLPQLRGSQPFNGTQTQKFVSTEIDNLYRYQESSGRNFHQFLSDFESWVRAGGNGRVQKDGALDIKLVLKNLNYAPEDLEGLLAYCRDSGPELLVGFHIAEAQKEDFDGREELERKLEALGVKTVLSLDTDDYLASSFPGHREQLLDRDTLQEFDRIARKEADTSQEGPRS